MGKRLDELLEKAGAVPVFRASPERLLIAQKAEGPRVYDVDNAGFIDYLGAGGASIVGFANQFVLDAVRKVLQGGVPEGFHVPHEVELAGNLAQFLPWAGSFWFCRSQDEAFRSVLHWARETTGHRRFLVLDGGAPLRVGAPAELAIEPSNPIREVRAWDVPKITAAVTSGSAKLAGLIVDPLLGRYGVVPPPAGALAEIAAACREAGVLLIMDERVAGFRVHRGGFSGLAGITPDVAVYGAALGGGFPIGAVAFRQAEAEQPNSGIVATPHPVSLAAADSILSILKNDSVYERLEERAEQLAAGLLGLAGRSGRPLAVNRVGSVLALYFSDHQVVDRASFEATDGYAYRRLAASLRAEGVLFPPEPGRAVFVSSSHGAKDVDETLAACERVLLRLAPEGRG
jgi:glutamate-1-semialdehyde 2,1-aminomutase